MREALPATPVASSPFERLYRASRDDVYAYVAGLLRDRAAAEEVTAAAFERAYRKRKRFDPARGSARAWLFGIARNAALDELRRRGRRADLFGEPPASKTVDEIDHTAASEARALLSSALGGLTTKERELVGLRYFADLTYAEIAAVLGTTESNVGTRLNRAVDKLREACNEHVL